MSPLAAASRRPLLAAVLVGAALVGVVLAVFTPAFQQNDDVVMAMIASGRGVAARGDAHLVFMNVLAGELLRRAYAWLPAWPWYGSLLVGALALAVVALLRDALARRAPLAPFLAWFAAVACVLAVRLQFTSVAGLAAGAGFVLWAAAIGREDGSPRARFLPAVLLLLGGLLRFDALLLVLVVSLPLAVDRLARAGGARAARQAGALGAVLAVAFALHALDRQAYARDPGWRAFLELNAWRARIVDYGAGGEGEARRTLEARLGWSANDGVALRRWLYADPAVFPVERMRALVTAAPVVRPDADEAWARLREAFSYPSLVPLALALPLLVSRAGRGGGRVLLLTLVPALAVVAALAVFLRAPEHVSLPALALAPTALLASARSAPTTGRSRGRAAAALAVAGSVLALVRCHGDSVVAREDDRDLRRSVALAASVPARLYVEWAGAFRYEAVLPLEDASYLDPLPLFSLGWPQRSPVADARLRAAGVDDVVHALFARDDVALLMNPAWADTLATYVREHYGADVRLRERLRTPLFTVFRLERTDTAPREPSR